jgi:hypothetical protein
MPIEKDPMVGGPRKGNGRDFTPDKDDQPGKWYERMRKGPFWTSIGQHFED